MALLPMDTRSWYTITVEVEHHMKTRLLRMTAAEWREEGTRIIRTWRGRDIRECVAYLNEIDRERKEYRTPRAEVVQVAPRVRSEFDIDFAVWRDMVEEPWKFGGDIVEWLPLNAKLMTGPGRWRVAAYWVEKQAEEDAKEAALAAPWRARYSALAKEAAVAGERAWIRRDIKRHVARFRAEAAARQAKQNAAVTRIAAAVRGHRVRTRMPFIHCSVCLSRRISPIKIGAGMMCRKCAEEGAQEDQGLPLGDAWEWTRKE